MRPKAKTLDQLQQAKALLAIKQVFFATILFATELEEANEWCPTAATDMVKIYYNREFLLSLKSTPLIMFVLAHEVMHILFKHGLRINGRDPELWNIACDYAINWVLKEAGFEIWDKCYIDARFAGMSAEQIYEILKKEEQARPRPPKGGQGGMDGDVMAPGKAPGSKPVDAEARAKIEQGIIDKVARAASMGRLAGKLPGCIERLITGVLNPLAPWPELLRDFVSRTVHDEENWSRRNRRFSRVVLPARFNEKMGEINVIVDVSGSISVKDLNQVAAEITALAETMRPERIRVIYCDAAVSGEEVFEEGQEVALHPKGGGGTDMRKALTHVEQYEPQVVILITDCETPWPNTEPEYPLLVLTESSIVAPIGRTVRL